jgi:ribosomal protein L7Ae-like RNA K-turn-binding protein
MVSEDFSKLTVKKLKELCDEKELKYSSNLKKDELIKLL